MTLSLELMTGVLAQEEPRQTGPDFGKASPFGLIVVVLLLIGVFLLVWSMNRHLRKLPESFDETPPDESDQAGDGTTGVVAETEPDLDPGPAIENPSDGTKREQG